MPSSDSEDTHYNFACCSAAQYSILASDAPAFLGGVADDRESLSPAILSSSTARPSGAASRQATHAAACAAWPGATAFWKALLRPLFPGFHLRPQLRPAAAV